MAVRDPNEVRVGADEHFAAFFAAMSTPSVRFAYLVCGDAARAEDAVAEAFARVLVMWRRGRVQDTAGYLRRAIVNELRSGWRRTATGRRVAERLAPAPPTMTPWEDRSANHEEIVTALRSLPAGQREALVLRFFEDLSEAATAEIMGCSVGTVKSQVARGLARLREHLGGDR